MPKTISWEPAFSVIEVEVKNSKGTTKVFVSLIPGLSALGQPPVIDFIEKPYEAARPALRQELHERVVNELTVEGTVSPTYRRLLSVADCGEEIQTIRISIVEARIKGWEIVTETLKRSPVFAMQLTDTGGVKIIPLNF